MGGVILRFSNWTWHVLSLCNSHNDWFEPKRATFEESCRKLGVAKWDAKELTDYQYLRQGEERTDPDQVRRMMDAVEAFADHEYDLVFAHSGREYGFHANHMEARNAVEVLTADGKLQASGVLYFCYKPGPNLPVRADEDKADYKLVLTDEELRQKGMLKRIFDSWAEGDFLMLNLWRNNEPEVEAFEVGDLAIQLPADFIRISGA